MHTPSRPLRFRPHDRVIDHLVGSQLYTSTDAAVRELLQNAEDACTLFSIGSSAYKPQIIVSYSLASNECEFIDNGLGMNFEAIENGFAWIGAPKTEVTHLRDLLADVPKDKRQIAQFGIGVLSCFGVAELVEVHTKMDSYAAIHIRVSDYHQDFEQLPPAPRDRGTAIRLRLKKDGPMKADAIPDAVRRYARHAPHVVLRDRDRGTDQPVGESWIDFDKSLPHAHLNSVEGILDGRLVLEPAWTSANQPFAAAMTLSNAGFLVSEKDIDLLPPNCTGFRAEVNVSPGTLTILMSREGFRRDEKWQALSSALGAVYIQLVNEVLDRYVAVLKENGPMVAAERGILLLSRGGVGKVLDEATRKRVELLLPRVITFSERGSARGFTLEELRGRVSGGTVFFIREDEGQQHRRHQGADGGTGFQVVESLTTTSLRALQLQASGKIVLSCHQRETRHHVANGEQVMRVHEADLLTQYAGQNGFPVRSVREASAEDVGFAPLPEGVLVNEVLDIGDGLKFINLPASSEAVIGDFSGRFLNAAHPDIQALLQVMPSTVGNPVLREIVRAYLDLESFQWSRARERLKALLNDPDLSDKAQLRTSPSLRAYLEKTLAGLTKRGGEHE